MTEIVYLRSKAYSFTLTDLNNQKVEEIKKLKGIGKVTIGKNITFGDYKDCLFNSAIKMNKMYTLNSEKHILQINEVNKKSTDPLDKKRYIYVNGILTDPYGIFLLYFI